MDDHLIRRDAFASFNMRRAGEERLKASRAPNARIREAHLELARLFEARAGTAEWAERLNAPIEE